MSERAEEKRSSYSNLEVNLATQEWTDGKVPIDLRSLPEAIPGQTRAYPFSESSRLHLAGTNDEKEVVRPSNRRRLIIIGAIIALIIIIGAVVGGILGTRHKKNTGTTPTPTQEPTPDLDHPSPADPRVLSDSKLSAVNWTSGDDASLYYRAVFWQATTRDLMASVWDSRSDNWTMVNITRGGSVDAHSADLQKFKPAKQGTPLAATVRLHPWPNFNSIALFYISESNTVEELVTNTLTAGQDWRADGLSSTGVKQTTAGNSQLASFSMSCNASQCNDRTYLFYQNSKGNIVTLNEKDWSKSSDLTYDDPQMGTGITVASMGLPGSSDNTTFTPRLFLQTRTQLQEKFWFPHSSSRRKIGEPHMDSDGKPVQFSSAMIPASGDTVSNSNDLLILSVASDKSQLQVKQYSNSTGDWTGSSTPKFLETSSSFQFTSGALVAGPDQARFMGLESNGTIYSFKINLRNTTMWSYEGVVF